MKLRTLGLVVAISVCANGSVLAQGATPTPVDSNIAVTTFARSQGNPCSGGPGSLGCGGCYPQGIPGADPTGQLTEVNPEWAPIGPMIPGVDASLPPDSSPVLLTGSVALAKINIGGDFPASHLTDDQNTFIILDPDKNGFLATGNAPGGCVGEGCSQVEMEWEINKYPLFAWAGEGDRITALGRWIFDCGHADAAPRGKCSNNASTECIVDSDCGGGTCTNPAPVFNYRAELHPPQAVAVMRNKSIGKTPATRADVYISAAGGGAGDRCIVEHLADHLEVLTTKSCFLNRCSVTTARSCLADSDCGKKETCVRFDPNGGLADINASDFEFDIPLPPQPAGATKLRIKAKPIKMKGAIVPKKATFVPMLGPTPVLHVIVPMTVPAKKDQLPNAFAQSISVAWKGDKTKLRKVQVSFTGFTINNPLKASTPAIPQVCTDPVAGGLSTTACTENGDCAAGICDAGGQSCHVNHDCASTDICSGASLCVGGVTPGWEVFGEVNGDWVRFTGLDSVGGDALFTGPPYVQPNPAPTVKQKFKFKEYVADDGSIHIATSGHSLNCIDTLYGKNLIEALQTFGFTAGANCLLGGDLNPGRVDVTFAGPDFSTPSGSPTTCTPSGKVLSCTSTSSGGDAGACSVTTSRLCVEDADCPMGETCTVSGGAFSLQYTIKAS
jgi:hypothetical protein